MQCSSQKEVHILNQSPGEATFYKTQMQHFKLKQTMENTSSKAAVLTGFFTLSLSYNRKMKKAVAQNQLQLPPHWTHGLSTFFCKSGSQVTTLQKCIILCKCTKLNLKMGGGVMLTVTCNTHPLAPFNSPSVFQFSKKVSHYADRPQVSNNMEFMT